MRKLLLLATFCVAMIPAVPLLAQQKAPQCAPLMDFYYITTGAPDSLIRGRQSHSTVLDTACKGGPLLQNPELQATAGSFSRPAPRDGS
jgi:hypothetical protein